jgi:hypothetical protein
LADRAAEIADSRAIAGGGIGIDADVKSLADEAERWG